jgi:UDP-3-O-[3-hydroxymyristoyl] N-acetylglucosamine deacetylase
MKQHTIKEPISATGIGVHSGKEVKITLKPAPVDTGIVFLRSNDSSRLRAYNLLYNSIPARVENVTSTLMATTIGKTPHKVTMVEHLLSACSGLHIDNLYVEVNDSNEMPIFDGSASVYSHLILEAGYETQVEDRKFLKVTEPFLHKDGDAYIIIEPHDKLEINFELTTVHPAFNQNHTFTHDCSHYIDEIAPARTFGFVSDLAKLRANDLALGASKDNCIPLDEYRPLIDKRFENEMIRHKVLDVLGDFYLLGYPFIGKISCTNSGHKQNNAALNHLLKAKLYEIITPKKKFTRKSEIYHIPTQFTFAKV